MKQNQMITSSHCGAKPTYGCNFNHQYIKILNNHTHQAYAQIIKTSPVGSACTKVTILGNSLVKK